MAEKSTKKAPAKKEQTLEEQLSAKRMELMDLRKSHVAGELVNPRAITAAKKEVARLLTSINQRKEA